MPRSTRARLRDGLVNPTWVPLCADLLRGSETAVCTVVGFPLGATLPEVKAPEAALVVVLGA